MEFDESIARCIRSGDAFCSMGRYVDALKAYSDGLAIDQKNVTLKAKQANTLLTLGKETEAYFSYCSCLCYGHVIDLVEQFVGQGYGSIHDDTVRLFDLLTCKYNIPITQDGLRLVVRKMQEERDESLRLSTWKKFEEKLDRTQFASVADIVDVFLKTFGERYFIHFFSFYCYLTRFKDPLLSTDRLIDIIDNRIKMRELEQFERLLKQRVRKKGTTLDRMSGVEFERYLATFFTSRGYKVELTKASHDQGTDLVLRKFGESIAVQAKRQKRPIGTTSIQEVVTAQRVHRTEKARVVTSSSFTKPAITLAQQLGVELWDRKRLLTEIRTPSHGVI